MAISLVKGQTINLDKEPDDLSSITVGLGWKVKGKNLLAKSPAGDDFDLDAVAFLLDDKGKLRNVGDGRLNGSDVIYFNNLRHPSGHVTHSGDNLAGGSGVEDNEQIVVDLASLGAQYARILFLVSMFHGARKGQHFGDIDRAFMRAVDSRGREIARYNLADDGTFNEARTLVFGEFYRKDGGWKFRALGEGHPADNFLKVLKNHL